MNNDIVVKLISDTLSLNRIPDNLTLWSQPTMQNRAVGQRDTSYGDWVVRLVHRLPRMSTYQLKKVR